MLTSVVPSLDTDLILYKLRPQSTDSLFLMRKLVQLSLAVHLDRNEGKRAIETPTVRLGNP